MKRMKITIPGLLPGKNEQINADRGNYYVGNRLKQTTQDKIFWTIRSQSRGKSFKNHVVVYVEFYEPWNGHHRRDDDNIIHGCKYILDTLVKMGIIKDDGPKYVKLLSERHVNCSEKDIHIEVTIEESGLTWKHGQLVKEARNGKVGT